MNMKLIQGDCIEKMRELEDGSIDMVLTDPPYGTTACKWDAVIPFEPMWEQLRRITKPNGAIVMTASQPFTSALVMSNTKGFRYSWVWMKRKPVGFLNARKRPMPKHEDVLVFSYGKESYYPQGLVENPKVVKRSGNSPYRSCGSESVRTHSGYPSSELVFAHDKNAGHPTQKPVALMEYLIKTYTNPGETVLDFTMGSGTTGVACANTGRDFIGIERDPDYFAIAKARIEAAVIGEFEI